MEIFPKTTPEHEVQWLVEAETFPRFVQMISMPEYTYNLILGFVLSVGGLSETLVSQAIKFIIFKLSHSFITPLF